jgi:hypothetical protein
MQYGMIRFQTICWEGIWKTASKALGYLFRNSKISLENTTAFNILVVLKAFN